MLFIRESLFIVFTKERLFMLFIRESLFIVFTKERLFMLFIRESLFIVFTKERLFMLFKFTCTVCKSEINSFYIICTLIFLILYYIFPVQMVVLDGNCAVGCGHGTDWMVTVL